MLALQKRRPKDAKEQSQADMLRKKRDQLFCRFGIYS
jgi:hypothetical protein